MTIPQSFLKSEGWPSLLAETPPPGATDVLQSMEIGETVSPAKDSGPQRVLTSNHFPAGYPSLSQYARWAESLWVKGGNDRDNENVAHAVLGLVGEAGEVAELFKKSFRGDGPIDEAKLIKELGDVIYYWARLCTMFDIAPEDVILTNMAKLERRKEQGTLQGSGSDR